MTTYKQRTDGCYSTRIRIDINDDGKANYKYLFVFSQDQVMALLKTLDGWWRMLVLLAWSTGTRCGELLGLRWSDVNEKNVSLR